jgi:hypothetical protein
LEGLEGRLAPATLTVTSAADPAPLHPGAANPWTPGTLRYAVAQADQDAAAGKSDTIVFNSAKMGTSTITLNQGPLELAPAPGAVTIDGGGRIILSGGQATRLFGISSGAQVVLSGLTIEKGSTQSFNGGGIDNFGTLTVSGCTFTLNSAVDGGGIENEAGGSLTVTDTTFTDNVSTDTSFLTGNGGGAIDNFGVATVSRCTFTGNTNSAILNERMGTLTLLDSTLSGNYGAPVPQLLHGFAGGGIDNFGTLFVADSTITGNFDVDGGGIYNRGALRAVNTIVADNIAGPSGIDPDIDGVLDSASANNLIGDGTGLSGISNGDANHNQVGTAASPIDPLLGPLGDYGGPTQTIPLLPGSPAVGAGSVSLAVDANGHPLTTDQRGNPRTTNGTIDIGAVQLGPAAFTYKGVLYLIGGADSNDHVNLQPTGAASDGSTGVSAKGSLGPIKLDRTYTGVTRIVFVGFAGNDEIHLDDLAALSVSIAAGNGNDQVQGEHDDGNVSVHFGNGNDNVHLGRGSNQVRLGDGNDNVQLGGGGNQVYLGQGNDNVQIVGGHNTVVLGLAGGFGGKPGGKGNDTVQIGNGSGNSVTVYGDGNDNVQIGDGDNNSVVVPGNGNDTVRLGNGNGNSVVLTGSGNDSLQTGDGIANGPLNFYVLGSGKYKVKLGLLWRP